MHRLQLPPKDPHFLLWDSSGGHQITLQELAERLCSEKARTNPDFDFLPGDAEALAPLLEALLGQAGNPRRNCTSADIAHQAVASRCPWPLNITDPKSRADQVRLGLQLTRLSGAIVSLPGRRATIHRLSRGRGVSSQWLVLASDDPLWDVFMDGALLFRDPSAG